jgi:hypothetical protein
MMSSRLTAILMILSAGALTAQDSTHDHHAAVDARGDKVMGFSHETTVHHFRLYDDGGAIEVESLKTDDTSTRDQIRGHLRHIATMFAQGNFQAPMLIHDQTPPGVPVMKKLRAEISYQYRQTERGAAVDIKTANRDAIAAVHEFLRFQISDHRTGDATTGARRP